MIDKESGANAMPEDSDIEQLEQLLLKGVSLSQEKQATGHSTFTPPAASLFGPISLDEEDEDESTESDSGGDLQSAIALFAEAAQDLATAGVELGLGRHFACADFCNQSAEKAAQAVSLLRYGRRTRYNHDLKALGEAAGAPPQIQDEMDRLTPFHPETFYIDTPPEEADDVINADEASSYIQSARRVLHWARELILKA